MLIHILVCLIFNFTIRKTATTVFARHSCSCMRLWWCFFDVLFIFHVQRAYKCGFDLCLYASLCATLFKYIFAHNTPHILNIHYIVACKHIQISLATKHNSQTAAPRRSKGCRSVERRLDTHIYRRSSIVIIASFSSKGTKMIMNLQFSL